MWAGVLADLDRYLAAQGVTGVSLVRAVEPPRPDEKSGKFRQVIGARLDRTETVSAR